jgi:hypothetical protein
MMFKMPNFVYRQVQSVNTLTRGIGIGQIYPEDRHELDVISIFVFCALLFDSQGLLELDLREVLVIIVGIELVPRSGGESLEEMGLRIARLQEYGMNGQYCAIWLLERDSVPDCDLMVTF